MDIGRECPDRSVKMAAISAAKMSAAELCHWPRGQFHFGLGQGPFCPAKLAKMDRPELESWAWSGVRVAILAIYGLPNRGASDQCSRGWRKQKDPPDSPNGPRLSVRKDARNPATQCSRS